ncbi:peptide chain release factor 1 [Candidatus Woesearchaeota archaeon]|nr:peptide chain release factor 1 [Candidatus Woesearchaeota archaeon]
MSKVSSLERSKLKKFVKELEGFRRGGTELVSVYVPQGYDLNAIINHLLQEQGTASNIKSKHTQKNVVDALERMVQHLRLFKKTPDNGLAVFSGNISDKEGQSDVQVYSIEPPMPLKLRLYRCDKSFLLEPLEDLTAIKEVYGLVVLDRRDAALALLKGKVIQLLRKTHSEVPGKTRAGGQSAQRFARLREGAAKEHYKKIAEHMKNEFLYLDNLKGIILGGPGTTTGDFLNKGYLTGDIQKKIIGVKDLSYTDEFGLQELLDKSQDLLAAEEIVDEKKIMARFFEHLAKDTGMTAYGEKDVMAKLQMGAVDTLLISESADDKIVEELEAKAEELNTTVKIISTDTREGVQLRDIGKIAAILRYRVE